MKVYKLAINHAVGESYAYRFADEPKESSPHPGVFRYYGERLTVYTRQRGLREEIVRVENLGPGTVYVSARNTINWFVEPEQIELPKET